jgi:hypothetical protein
VVQPKGGMYFAYASVDLTFWLDVFVRVFAQMLAPLGACCCFPRLYSVLGDCTGVGSCTLGWVSSVHVSCPTLFLQVIMSWGRLFCAKCTVLPLVCVNILEPGKRFCGAVRIGEMLSVPGDWVVVRV